MGGRNGDKAPGGRGARRPAANDTVVVYHRTSERAADAIAAEGFKPQYAPGANEGYRAENSKYVFVTRRPNAQAGYGSGLVSIRVKRKDVEPDPYSGHYRIKINKVRPKQIKRE